MNNNLSKLLPKTWWLIALALSGGFFVGLNVVEIGDDVLAPGLVALYSMGVIWAGHVAGYQTRTNEK